MFVQFAAVRVVQFAAVRVLQEIEVSPIALTSQSACNRLRACTPPPPLTHPQQALGLDVRSIAGLPEPHAARVCLPPPTQEALGLDVLVHGESERTDMVEYFGVQLDGMWFTEAGWVQSYGSRCVRPPLVVGDVRFVQPMTVWEYKVRPRAGHAGYPTRASWHMLTCLLVTQPVAMRTHCSRTRQPA